MRREYMSETRNHPSLTIFVTGDVNDDQMAQIRSAAPGAACRYFAKQADLEEHVEEADVIAGRVTPAGLARAKRLKWVQSWAAGPDEALFPEMVESSVTLT